MKTFKDLAINRRSHRKFTDMAIEQEKIDSILQTVLMAPAGKRANEWFFYVVTDKEKSLKLSECKQFGAAFVKEAPLNIVVTADTTKSDVWIEDCSIAAIYLQLAAQDLGLGSCWSQVRGRESMTEGVMAEDYIKKLLNIPSEYAVECIISIGYPADERQLYNLEKLPYEKIIKS
ncbi:MAG: nitroreductase family protein [Paludibacteraceae bacterium]|nr:nitroreductase family protein [Paludibacteraceae bacterium]